MADRISGANFITVGGKRLFQNKNLGASIPGTVFDAPWQNGVQEELIAGVIEGTGQTPDVANNFQVAEGVVRFASNHLTAISASRGLTVADVGTIFIDATAGDVALQLPHSNTGLAFPLRYCFVRADTTGHNVTVTLSAGDVWHMIIGTPSWSRSLDFGVPLEVINDGGISWVPLLRRPSFLGTFSASGSFVAPTTMWDYEVEGWGGGGGGGGSAVNGGVGGGGGGYFFGKFALQPGSTTAITIGAGGTAGGSGGGNGGNGGTTSLGSLASATGGVGGGGDVGGFGGGGPGSASGGAVNLAGIQGGLPYSMAGSDVMGGFGGSAFKSASGPPAKNTTGNFSPFPGAGGGAAGGGANAGAAGTSGVIIIRGVA